jgi:hypothetical protein
MYPGALGNTRISTRIMPKNLSPQPTRLSYLSSLPGPLGDRDQACSSTNIWLRGEALAHGASCHRGTMNGGFGFVGTPYPSHPFIYETSLGNPGKRMKYECLQDEGVDCSSHRMRAHLCVGSQRSQWSSREDIILSSIPLNKRRSSEKNSILPWIHEMGGGEDLHLVSSCPICTWGEEKPKAEIG